MINKEAIAPVKSVDKVPEIIDLKPSDINSFLVLFHFEWV